jgi:alkyl-hydroperoxide reductase/thiol specific antioxidant family protein
LREREHLFRDKGANLAAVGLGDRIYARQFLEETGITFPLLIDEQRLAYRAAGLGVANILHLLRADNAKARTRARAAGHHQRRLGRNPFQLGGSFVFGPGNVDLFAHVSKTFGDSASPDALAAALARAGFASA